jgi:hypothetical protein
MAARPVPPGIEEGYRRTARRLFGVRSDDYEVAEEMIALLLARDIREHQGLSDDDSALVACEVFPDADREEVVKLLNGTTPTPKGDKA